MSTKVNGANSAQRDKPLQTVVHKKRGEHGKGVHNRTASSRTSTVETDDERRLRIDIEMFFNRQILPHL